MNSIIFCEGRTDAVLIGQYLSKHKGWEWVSKGKEGMKLKSEDSSQIVNHYILNGDWLYIWGVGGNTRFINPLKSALKLNYLGNSENSFDKIIIVIDRDEEENIDSLVKEFSDYIECSCSKDGEWTQKEYTNRFGESRSVEVMVLVIPFDENGALETIMLSALSEEDDELIIPQCKKFIDGLETKKYLQKRREKLKAKLSTVVSVRCPDRAVDSLLEIVEGVNWSNYQSVNESFKKLLEV